MTLYYPMDCSLPGSFVHGILQAKILEWVAIPFPGYLPDPGIKPWSPACRQISYHLSHQGTLKITYEVELRSERLSNLPKVTQPVSTKVRI